MRSVTLVIAALLSASTYAAPAVVVVRPVVVVRSTPAAVKAQPKSAAKTPVVTPTAPVVITAPACSTERRQRREC